MPAGAERVHFGSGYVSVRRERSVEREAELIAIIVEKTGAPFETNGNYGDKHFEYNGLIYPYGRYQYGNDLLHQMFERTGYNMCDIGSD